MAGRVRLYRRGKIWWCWFYDHRGRRVRASTHQSDRSLARTAGQRLEREHLAAPAGGAQTVREVIGAYLANCERRGRAGATLEFYLRKAAPLLRELGSRMAHELTPADLEAYIDHRRGMIPVVKGRRPARLATVAKELGLLRSALKAARTGLDLAALFPALGGTYVPRDRALSHAEYRSLLLAMDPERSFPPGKGQRKRRRPRNGGRRDYLTAWCYLGVRESELYALRTADLTETAVHIPGKKTRQADRWIPISPEVAEVLKRRAEAAGEGPLFPLWRNVRQDLIDACERAGVARVSCNDLRRTFATWLAEAGVPEAVTASLLGHASTAMVRRVYTRIGRAAQVQAIASLPRFGAAPSSTVTAGVTDANGSSVLDGTRRTTSGEGSGGNYSEIAEDPVPRAGIEPATRGFSVLAGGAGKLKR